MNATQWVESKGVRVWAEGDTLTLEGLSCLAPEQAASLVEYARENKARLLEELEGVVELPWPEPEYGHLTVCSESWKYFWLFTLVTEHGAVLVKETDGKVELRCPATMPADRAHVAKEGVTEMTGYLQRRLALQLV